MAVENEGPGGDMFVSSRQVHHLIEVAEHCKKQDMACVLKDYDDKLVRLPGLAQGVWSGIMFALGALTGEVECDDVADDADSTMWAAIHQYAESHASEIAEQLGLEVEEATDDDD